MSNDRSELEKRLLRQLHGESDSVEDGRLDRRAPADASWRRRSRELEQTWRALTPPPEGPPPNLEGPLVAWARAEAGEMRWQTAPLWVRAASAASLAAGLAMGLALGLLAESALPAPGTPSDLSVHGAELFPEEASLDWEPEPAPSLADAYWRAVEASGGKLTADGENREPAP